MLKWTFLQVSRDTELADRIVVEINQDIPDTSVPPAVTDVTKLETDPREYSPKSDSSNETEVEKYPCVDTVADAELEEIDVLKLFASVNENMDTKFTECQNIDLDKNMEILDTNVDDYNLDKELELEQETFDFYSLEKNQEILEKNVDIYNLDKLMEGEESIHNYNLANKLEIVEENELVNKSTQKAQYNDNESNIEMEDEFMLQTSQEDKV